jgi:hypothetical protein
MTREGFIVGSIRVMEGMPECWTESHVEQTLATGWELRLEAGGGTQRVKLGAWVCE